MDYRVVDAGNNTLNILGRVDGSTDLTLTSDVGKETSFTYDGLSRGATILVVDGLPCPILMGLPFMK